MTEKLFTGTLNQNKKKKKKKKMEKILSGIPSECQTVRTLIRPDDSSCLIGVEAVCQGYQQTTLVKQALNVVCQAFSLCIATTDEVTE